LIRELNKAVEDNPTSMKSIKASWLLAASFDDDMI